MADAIRFFPAVAAAAVVVLGLTVIVGWHTGNSSLIQISPGLVPMQYNTAIGFALGGGGLLALVIGQSRMAMAPGLLLVLIGLLTFLEYLLGLDLGIDEMFMKHYILVATSNPGRMAPNTAICFMIYGLALIAAGCWRQNWRCGAAVGLLATLVAGLGVVAFSGYVADLETAYGWGRLTRMAVHTSLGFVVLGLGMLALAWRVECSAPGDIPQWVPMAATGGLVVAAIALWQAVYAKEQALVRAVGDLADGASDELVLFFGLAMAGAVYLAMSAAQRARAAAVMAEREVAERRLAEERLSESELRFRTYFDMGMAGFAETSPEKGWVRVNDELCRILGYSPDELSGLTWAELTHPDDLAADVAQFERLLRGEIEGYSLEKRFLRKDGRVVPTIMSVRMRRKPDGSPDYLFAVMLDISERKKLEEMLLRSNAELEQFAYVASHDLQEPLRNVTAYTQLLERKFGDRLDEDGREFLDFIIGGAKRASSLIRDLLSFSRVAAQTEKPVPTDSALVIEGVLQDMETRLRESDARISISAMPWVAAAPEPLAHVFQNLIGNALKYRHPERKSEIAISAERVHGDWRFSVKDNGIGIDSQYFERIFMIFKRLHSQEAYEGTGIGLAICKRVIERFGGRIWVESRPGEGSVFHFTLKAAEPL